MVPTLPLGLLLSSTCKDMHDTCNMLSAVSFAGLHSRGLQRQRLPIEAVPSSPPWPSQTPASSYDHPTLTTALLLFKPRKRLMSASSKSVSLPPPFTPSAAPSSHSTVPPSAPVELIPAAVAFNVRPSLCTGFSPENLPIISCKQYIRVCTRQKLPHIGGACCNSTICGAWNLDYIHCDMDWQQSRSASCCYSSDSGSP